MRLSIIFILLVSLQFSFAQNKGTITGNIQDADTEEELIGVNIINSEGVGTTTDFDGNFTLVLPIGEHLLRITYIGYETVEKVIEVKSNGNPPIKIEMTYEAQEFDELVVSGSKYAKRVSEEVISIEVIKPELMDNTNAIRLDELANKVSGLQVSDGPS